MKSFFVSISFFAILFSCQKSNSSSVKDVSNDSVVINQTDNNFQKIPDFCFEKKDNQDTILLKYSDNLGTVTGKMLYKSGNSQKLYGDLVGIKVGDTLKLDLMYSQGESIKSKEFWFILQEGNLIEGKANYDASGEKYIDTKSLKYNKDKTIIATDCNKINL